MAEQSKRARGRPSSPRLVTYSFGMTPEMMRRIDGYHRRRRDSMPGLTITKAGVVRELIEMGLAASEGRS